MKKEIRIKKNEEISDIISKKKNYNSRYFYAYWLENNSSTRVAVVASKKIFPKAIDRNHAKRILREAFRPCLKENLPIDIIFISKKDLLTADFATLSMHMQEMITKLKNKINKNSDNIRKEVK